MQPSAVSKAPDALQEFYHVSLANSARFRQQYAAYDDLVNCASVLTRNDQLRLPRVEVVIKACELIQEALTLRVNLESLSAYRTRDKDFAAIHSFLLPKGFHGVEIPLPQETIAPVVHSWIVNYRLILKLLAQTPGFPDQIIAEGALTATINRIIDGFMSSNEPMFRSPDLEIPTGLNDIIFQQRWNSSSVGPQRHDYRLYVETTTNALKTQLRALKADKTLLTRLDRDWLHAPRDFYESNEIIKNLDPEELAVLSHKCVLAQALDFVRRRGKIVVSSLITATENYHRSEAERILQSLYQGSELIPVSVKSAMMEDHVFHCVARASIKSSRPELLKTLQGLSAK